MAVANLVREKRIEKELTQTMIAAFIGTHRSYVSLVEKSDNHRIYNLDQLNLIAELIGCSPKDFIPENPIVGKEDKNPKKKHPKKKKG